MNAANTEMMQKQRINATLITATEKHTKSKKECVGGKKAANSLKQNRNVKGH